MIGKEGIELSKSLRIERLNSEGLGNRLRYLLKKRGWKRLLEKSLKERGLFKRSKKRRKDRREEETGRLRKKRDLSIPINLKMKSIS